MTKIEYKLEYYPVSGNPVISRYEDGIIMHMEELRCNECGYPIKGGDMEMCEWSPNPKGFESFFALDKSCATRMSKDVLT
jgi:hypothetical protein